MTPSAPSSTSSGNRCTIAPRPSLPGAGRRRSSRSIWGEQRRDMLIRRADVEDAVAACAAMRRSIAELCKADHHDDPVIVGHWLANKTPENVKAWIEDQGNQVLVAVEG